MAAGRRCTYIEPSDDVLRVVAARMRPEDVAEALALGFSTPLTALEVSREQSSLCIAAASSDDQADVLGVGGLITRAEFGGVAVPWAILTEAGARRKRWVMREARSWLSAWSQQYELRNGVHAENRRGREFVEALGFVIRDEPYRHEATGAEFLFFAMPRSAPMGVPLCASS